MILKRVLWYPSACFSMDFRIFLDSDTLKIFADESRINSIFNFNSSNFAMNSEAYLADTFSCI